MRNTSVVIEVLGELDDWLNTRAADAARSIGFTAAVPYWIVSIDVDGATMWVRPATNWDGDWNTVLRFGDTVTVPLDPTVRVERVMSNSTVDLRAFAEFVNGRDPSQITELAQLLPGADPRRVGTIFPWLDGGDGEGVDWEYCVSIGKGPDPATGELPLECVPDPPGCLSDERALELLRSGGYWDTESVTVDFCDGNAAVGGPAEYWAVWERRDSAWVLWFVTFSGGELCAILDDRYPDLVTWC